MIIRNPVPHLKLPICCEKTNGSTTTSPDTISNCRWPGTRKRTWALYLATKDEVRIGRVPFVTALIEDHAPAALLSLLSHTVNDLDRTDRKLGRNPGAAQ